MVLKKKWWKLNENNEIKDLRVFTLDVLILLKLHITSECYDTRDHCNIKQQWVISLQMMEQSIVHCKQPSC